MFLPSHSLGTFAGIFSTTMKMLLVKTQKFGHATGLRKGAVKGVVLVWDTWTNNQRQIEDRVAQLMLGKQMVEKKTETSAYCWKLKTLLKLSTWNCEGTMQAL